MPAFIPVLDQLLQRGSGASNMGTTPGVSSILGELLPGVSGMAGGATDVINNLLKGQPSTGTARRANAYFGGSSGMPGSDFVRNRGFDLYNEQGEQRQQRGIQDFLSLLGGFTPLAGQEQSGNEFDATMNFNREQSAIDNALNAAKFGLQKRQVNESGRPRPGGYISGPSFSRNDETGPRSWLDRQRRRY